MKKYWVVLALAAVVVAAVVYRFAGGEREGTSNVVVGTANPSGPLGPAAPKTAQNLPNAGHPFLDTSMLKPPAGAKVAIFEFEDLECPACAHAAPIVHAASAQYKVPLVRYDYPWSFHVWSFDAAVTARYIQDKVSPQLADDFRRDVFAGQSVIASKDDLARFTATWFQAHGQTMPFVMDPNGACKAEVESDRALGDRLGVRATPCILVVTENKFVAVDAGQLDETIKAALRETSAASS